MFKEKLEKVRQIITNNEGKNNKKKVENLVFFLIILVITIIAINVIWKDDNKEKNDQINNGVTNKKLASVDKIDEDDFVNVEDEASLKHNLEDILGKIDGVGKVSVLITYSETSQTVAMYNENTKETSTEEKDEAGGTRLIKESDTQKDVIFKESGGQKEPIIQKTLMPKIEGAIITAEGAYSANTKTNIIQAVEAVTGLATHKIQVFEMRK